MDCSSSVGERALSRGGAVGERPPCTTLAQVLAWQAQTRGSAVAFRSVDLAGRETELSYGALDHAAAYIGALLVRSGVGKGPVLLVYPQGLDLVAAILGCLYADVIAVPAELPGNGQSLDRLRSIVLSSGCRAVLTSEALRWSLGEEVRSFDRGIEVYAAGVGDDEGLRLEVASFSRADGPALLDFGSSSISDPNGVVVSHRALLSSLEMITQSFGYSEEDVFLSWLPQTSGLGLIGCVLETIYLGASCVLMPRAAFVSQPATWLQAITGHEVTVSGAPDLAYDRCSRAPEHALRGVDLRSWRVALVGPEPAQHETLRRFTTRLEPYGFSERALVPVYGCAGATICTAGLGRAGLSAPVFRTFDADGLEHRHLEIAGSRTARRRTLVGCRLGSWPGQDLRAVDPCSKQELARGTIGEIWVAGAHVSSGRWRGPGVAEEASGSRLCGAGDTRFLRTGDLGFVDDEGNLFITGSLGELIAADGAQHHPDDLETTVEAACPDVEAGKTAAFVTDLLHQSPLSKRRSALCVVAELKADRQRAFDPAEAAEAISGRLMRVNGALVDRVVFLEPMSASEVSSREEHRRAVRRELESGSLAVLATWPEDAREPGSIEASYARALAFLRSRLAEMLDLADEVIEPQVELSALSLDSVHYRALIAAMDRELGLTPPPSVMLDDPTLDQLARALAESGRINVDQRSKGRTSDARLVADQLARIPQFIRDVDRQSGREVVINGELKHDFASCNYLGFDYHPEIIAAIPEMVQHWGVHPSWTRAVASPAPYAELEARLARLIGAPSTLVFPNVAMINIGCLPILAGPRGTIIADNRAHNTIQEACELASARGVHYCKFRHGDLDDLSRQLEQHQSRRPLVVALDGVYSMSFDLCTLKGIAELAREHDAVLYVDDAHGFGILGESPSVDQPYGRSGSGIVRHLGLDYLRDRIVYVAGLSKAYSSHAAFISCFNERVRAELRLASTLVFSGPVPVATLASALKGLEVNAREGDLIRAKVLGLTRRLVDGARSLGLTVDNTGMFPGAFVVVGDMEQGIAACQLAWKHDLLITPGVYPAVPKTRCGLRFALTALNTQAQVDIALEALEEVRELRQRCISRSGRVEQGRAREEQMVVTS